MNGARRPRTVALALALGALLQLATAHAEEDKSGLKANTLSLPAGPGSLEGIGENVDLSLNMGTASYAVPIPLPKGYATLSPSLALRYNSGAGSAVVGLGWSLGEQYIERMTSRGLPSYSSLDTFATQSGDELVRLPGTSTFRARYESGFVRYTWLGESASSGKGGSWKAEYPDGSVSTFGADTTGDVATARLASEDGVRVFRYYLIERRDTLGHTVRYSYAPSKFCLPPLSEQTPHVCEPVLTAISWVFAGATPRYQALFTHEDRPDKLSDGKPGFDVRLGERLASVSVQVRGAQGYKQQRKVALTYDDSSGLSMLSSVRTFGPDGTTENPIVFSFAYTDSLADPFVVSDLGSAGVDFRSGYADLTDLNSDGLPDIVNTYGPRHQISLSNKTPTGQVLAAPFESASSGSMSLSSPTVRMADIDGDGRSDMLSWQSGDVLWNRGDGDWELDESALGGIPEYGTNANLQFFDYNHDKKIDLLSNGGDTCFVYLSNGTGQFAAAKECAMAPGAQWSFAAGVQLADMNGDGLQDLAKVIDGTVQYRLYLGDGQWLATRTMVDGPAFTTSAQAHLVDINGDSAADVVKVLGAASSSEIGLYINQGSTSFVKVEVAASNGDISFGSDDSVRFCDMNGNGSTDVVRIENPSGKLSFLDLYPKRAGLLAQVQNGIGQTIRITYGSSVDHMARDGGPSAWTDRLPSPMLTVDRIERWAMGSGDHQVRSLHFTNGYYDSEEKQFRGFARVLETVAGEAPYTEEGLNVHTFDVGKTDRYRKGLLLSQEVYSAGRLLSQTENTYSDCALAGVPSSGLVFPIRYVCQTASETTQREGLDVSQSVTTREESTYDGYGNVTKVAKLGVIKRGGAACGTACEGDELYEETTYAAPQSAGGPWLLRAPTRKVTYGRPGGDASETLTYYDGAAFVGLELGQVTRGLVTRVTDKVRPSEAALVATARHRYDAHGNVVELLDANGHRRLIGYDADGVLPTFEEIVFDDASHPAYGLRQSVTYDPVLELPASSTDWQRLEAGSDPSPARATSYGYDALGRLGAIAKPGDTLARPTQRFEYNLVKVPGPARLSSIVSRTRSDAASDAYDLVTVKCFDGLGRSPQTLTRIGARDGSDVYQASGYEVFNEQGEAKFSYQPYEAFSLNCSPSPPLGVLRTETTRDAAKRVRTGMAPDNAIYGRPSVTRTDYAPLMTTAWDPEDLDSSSPHAGTPQTTRVDGLGRTTRIERMLAVGEPAIEMAVGYDSLGNIASVADDAGNTRRWTYDLIGRIVAIADPDAGAISFTHDAVGNVLTRRDARGVTVAMRYDEANRMLAEWDEARPDATRVTLEYDGASGCTACTAVEGKLARTTYPLEGVFAQGSMGEDTFGFDDRGRATYSGREIRDHVFATTMTYDNADRVASVTHPDGRVVRPVLDAAGRVIAVEGQVGSSERYVEAVSYTARGQQSELLLGNRTRTQQTFDALMRVSGIETHTETGELVQGYGYERDRVGNLRAIRDALAAGVGTTPSAQATYGYDGLYRLTSAVLDAGRAAHETLAIEYNRIDNIVSMTSDRGETSRAHVGAYRYAAMRPHAVVQAGPRAYGYDASGNVTTRGDQTLAWDHNGRLGSVSVGGGPVAEYGYGIDRERVVKREGKSFTYYITPDFEVRNGVATAWVKVGGARVVKVQDPSLAATMLPDLAPIAAPDGKINVADAHAALVAGRDLETVDMLLTASAMAALVGAGGAVTSYVHQNHLGSNSVTTDEAGAVLQRTESHPYGEARWASNYLEDYSWTGQERDLAAAISYHSARYLDTWAGRWLQPDPLFLSDPKTGLERPGEAANLYGYVRNNPVNASDPAGLATVELGVFLSAFAGPVGFTFQLGVAFDDDGGVAVAASGGAKAGLGAQAATGGYGTVTSADTVADLSGPSVEITVEGLQWGGGAVMGIDATTNLPTYGGGTASYGLGLGAGKATTGGTTLLIPLRTPTLAGRSSKRVPLVLSEGLATSDSAAANYMPGESASASPAPDELVCGDTQ